VTAVLSTNELTVRPGEQVTCTVQVRNTGSVVDEFTFDVLGSAEGWASVDPPRLTLYPGAEGSVTVRFAPPRTADVPAGRQSFGLRVKSREDEGSTTVEEGVLDVQPFEEAFAELVPRTAHGRRTAKYELALDNRGNARLNAPLATVDPDDVLRFRVDPPTLVAEPGTAAFAKVIARPRTRFWRGPNQTKSFQVVAQPEGMQPLTADGTMLQGPLLPDWFGKALLAALALAGLLVVLWLTLLKPAIKSTAKKAARREVAAPATQAAIKNAAAQQVAAPPTQAAIQKAAQAAVAGSTTTTVASQTPRLRGAPIDGRLTTTGSGTDAYTVPAGQVLQVTDIVLENMPSDDKGTFTVSRSGTVLLSVALENFRDLDYHFVSPIIFAAGQQLQITSNVTTCTTICQPAMYYSGYQGTA
jgi:hypothetical protein